jgi:hypothetical protein
MSIMGWDDLLVAAVGAMVSAGANKAVSGNTEFNGTTFGNVPQMETQQGDPFAWVNDILRQQNSLNNSNQ